MRRVHFGSSHSCPPSSIQNEFSHFIPTSSHFYLHFSKKSKKQKPKKLPCRHGMLTLRFLEPSMPDNVLEVASPPAALGAGAGLHTDILVGKSAGALGPLGNVA